MTSVSASTGVARSSDGATHTHTHTRKKIKRKSPPHANTEKEIKRKSSVSIPKSKDWRQKEWRRRELREAYANKELMQPEFTEKVSSKILPITFKSESSSFACSVFTIYFKRMGKLPYHTLDRYLQPATVSTPFHQEK